MKKILTVGTIILASAVSSSASNSDVILHAWSWNFPTIAQNMHRIADAGYTMVQVSPVQECFNPYGDITALFDRDGTGGNWYFYYQPTDWKVGNPIVGTRDQLKEMLDSAKAYNIKVIVDVLPNHTAFDVDAVADEFYDAVGGRQKMFHSNGLDGIRNYQDRTECTLQGVGGLPDVNTENPLFQKYYMQFVNDLLALGVRGFRYDTAKHIGVHSDPVDSAAGVKENDFWDVATGRKAVKGVKLALPADSLFIYGEVLQDVGVPEQEYSQYMGQTASSYGHKLRKVLEHGNAKGVDLKAWDHQAAPESLVSWVESHDTYANEHESRVLSDDQIRQGWVFLTARDAATPLFFSRPMGSSAQKVWGDNVAGARGNDEFFHPEVIAANKFRRQMIGEPETIEVSDGGELISVSRGSKGMVITNISGKSVAVDLPTSLPNGSYKDSVHSKPFIVKNGKITGLAAPLRSYVITK